MKKISLMIAALGASLAFTACTESSDDHPILGTTNGQTVEFLNTPEMANMALQITNENKEGNVHMTCSQPEEYGFAAPVVYAVEVALNENFTTPAVEGCPAAVLLPTTYGDCAQINPSNEEIARAMCEMLDIQSSDQIPTPYYKLYMRLIANVGTTTGAEYPNTTLVSNTVSLAQVSVGYLAIVIPGLPSGLYLRGGMNDWNADPEWEFLTTGDASIFEIEDCYIAKGTQFKVADASWGPVNCGVNGPLKFNEPYELDLNSNSGNIEMPENFSGRVQLTVKGGKYIILFEAAEPDTPDQPTGVYLRGDFNGWGADAASEFLTTDIKHVWVIQNVTITAGTFKVADANWSDTNLGAVDDSAIEPGTAYALAPGGGNINITDTFTGKATLSVKGGTYYLTLTPDL